MRDLTEEGIEPNPGSRTRNVKLHERDEKKRALDEMEIWTINCGGSKSTWELPELIAAKQPM